MHIELDLLTCGPIRTAEVWYKRPPAMSRVVDIGVLLDFSLLQFKLNTDESPGVAAEYGIRSIPTVMIFKDGTKMDTVIGAVPKTTLTQTLEKYL